MDHAADGTALPTAQELRHTLTEHAGLLQGPSLPDPVEARVRRIVASTSDLLDRMEEGGTPDGAETDAETVGAITRAIAWTAEAVGAFQRLPSGFAFTRATTGEVSPALALIDDLDLLGLTLDHTYDAVARDDLAALEKQLAVLEERFVTDTEPVEMVEDTRITEDDLDQDRVEELGLEVGDDGIPRMPVPDQRDATEQPDATDQSDQADEPAPDSPDTPETQPEEATS